MPAITIRTNFLVIIDTIAVTIAAIRNKLLNVKSTLPLTSKIDGRRSAPKIAIGMYSKTSMTNLGSCSLDKMVNGKTLGKIVTIIMHAKIMIKELLSCIFIPPPA